MASALSEEELAYIYDLERPEEEVPVVDRHLHRDPTVQNQVRMALVALGFAEELTDEKLTEVAEVVTAVAKEALFYRMAREFEAYKASSPSIGFLENGFEFALGQVRR